MLSEPPIEMVLLTNECPTSEIIAFYADLADPSLVTLPTSDGATATVFHENGQPVLTMTTPKLIDYDGDLSRVLGVDDLGVSGPRFWSEVVVPDVSEKFGMVIAASVADHCGGTYVLRTILDVG